MHPGKTLFSSLLLLISLTGQTLLVTMESLATQYTVTRKDNAISTNSDPPILSLRETLSLANQNPGMDLIILLGGTYTLSIAGSDEDNNLTGDLDILDSVVIVGAGPNNTIIDGGGIDRVFDIGVGATTDNTIVQIENLTIQNGRTGAAMARKGGAGILSERRLILNNVVIRNNTVEGGELDSVGGGVYITNSGTLNMTNTTISGNQARQGGGLFVAPLVEVKINQSLFTGNQGYVGSAIQSYGSLQLINTTIDDNKFNGQGGYCALSVDGTATVSFCTIMGNLNSDGSQSSGVCTSTTGLLSLSNTILAGNKQIDNSTSINCQLTTTLTSATNNLEDANTCGFSPATNLINTDPKLGPLQDNGGPTQTRALAADSPAIDYVKVNTGVTVDQRGSKRPVGPWADIGAYEYERDVSPICFPIRSSDGKTAVICL